MDATRVTTDISGFHYRIRATNVCTQQLTGITVVFVENKVQEKQACTLRVVLFLSQQETRVSTARVTANEGIDVTSDCGSPTKALGLPEADR